MASFHPRFRGFPPELPFVWDAATLGNGANLTLTTDLGDIDRLAEVSGWGGAEVKANAVRIHAFDRDIWTLDLPSLIRANRASGRDKDLRYLPELESQFEAEDDAGNGGEDARS